jgi:hypothetical protein
MESYHVSKIEATMVLTRTVEPMMMMMVMGDIRNTYIFVGNVKGRNRLDDLTRSWEGDNKLGC